VRILDLWPMARPSVASLPSTSCIGKPAANSIAKENRPIWSVCGDFNVAPHDVDIYDPNLWRGAIMASDGERAALPRIMQHWPRDTLRSTTRKANFSAWWDYQMRAF